MFHPASPSSVLTFLLIGGFVVAAFLRPSDPKAKIIGLSGTH
jgi:hypothetical protein